MSDDHDPIAELERLDRFFDGEEEGERPIDVLRNSGISIPDERDLHDDSLQPPFDRDRLLPMHDVHVDEEIQ